MLVLARGVILDHALAVWARPRVVIPVLAVPVFASAAWLVTGLSRRLSCILLAIFFTRFFLWRFRASCIAASAPSPAAFSSGPAGPRLSSRLSSLLDMAHLRQRQDREHEDPEDGVKDISLYLFIYYIIYICIIYNYRSIIYTTYRSKRLLHLTLYSIYYI